MRPGRCCIFAGLLRRNLNEQNMDMGVSQNRGYLLGGPYNKVYSIWGSILGYPNFGKQPYIVRNAALPIPKLLDSNSGEPSLAL